MADRTEEIKELNEELDACLQSGEFLDALDICEEIEALGQMEVKHWLAMARCLVELRRKADAKRAWLRVVEIETDQPEALEGLNKHFPGWRRQAVRPAPSAGKPSRPVVRRSAQIAETAPPAPESPPERAAPARSRPPAVSAQVPSPAPANDALVNWAYVMEDVADAEAARVNS